MIVLVPVLGLLFSNTELLSDSNSEVPVTASAPVLEPALEPKEIRVTSVSLPHSLIMRLCSAKVQKILDIARMGVMDWTVLPPLCGSSSEIGPRPVPAQIPALLVLTLPGRRSDSSLMSSKETARHVLEEAKTAMRMIEYELM